MKRKLILLFLITSLFAQNQDEVYSVFTGSFGSVTLDEQIYNQISFMPEMSRGKLGIGMDLYFYFDSDGNLSENNWNFKSSNNSFKTIVDKIYYIRWGQPLDDFYFRFGSLPNTTLGKGSLVKNYSNVIDYPSVRRKGIEFNYQFAELSFQFIHSDFKEYNAPSVIAASTSFEFVDNLELNLTLATDPNQLNGLEDRDDDGKADFIDQFPDDEFYWHDSQLRIEELNDRNSALGSPCYNTHTGNWLDVNNDGYSDHCENQKNNLTDEMNNFLLNSKLGENRSDDEVSGLSFGLSYNLTDRFAIYSEFTQLFGKSDNPNITDDDNDLKLGSGLIPIGFQANWDKVSFSLDYRQNSEKFLFHYWDQNYDNNRVMIYQNTTNDGVTAETKEENLYKYGQSQGVQLSISSYIKYFGLSFSYAHMNSDIWNNIENKYKKDNNNTLYVKFDIDASIIEKVRIAEIFYQQSNVPDAFDFDPNQNSLFGYNLGIDMAENMTLILKGRKSYVPSGFDTNNKIIYDPVRTTQIETQILF